MQMSIRPLTEQDTTTLFRWRYPQPYDIYNPTRDSLFWLLDPANRYHVMLDVDEAGAIISFFCLGQDAQVRGGNYTAEDALDVGFALRPDLVGQGLGADILRAVLAFAERELAPRMFRVTVATFNGRARRLYEKLGFEVVRLFQGQGIWYQYAFVQMLLTRDI